MQAVLSRAELLLSSGCSAQPALKAAVSAMDGAVAAWARVEAEEAEKRAKEAEILKYKMQEHVVRSSCSSSRHGVCTVLKSVHAVLGSFRVIYDLLVVRDGIQAPLLRLSDMMLFWMRFSAEADK